MTTGGRARRVLTTGQRYRQYLLGVLAQACDEAPIGIWEPYWWANNVLRDLPTEERLDWAARAMTELLKDDLIRFYHQQWPGQDDPRHPLSSDEARAAIPGDLWRRIPLEESCTWFEATLQGDLRMNQMIEAGEWLGEASVEPR